MDNYRAEVEKMLDKQDEKGLSKYGHPLEQSPDGAIKRLNHLAEELVDGLRYTFWLKDGLDRGSLYHFPPVRFVGETPVLQQIKHLKSEIIEVEEALGKSDKDNLILELWDVIHSAETALRIISSWGEDVFAVKKEVYRKNDDRGYYNEF